MQIKHPLVFIVILFLWAIISPAKPDSKRILEGPQAAKAPLLKGKPFIVVWNMPTSRCQKKYGVSLDLNAFDIIANNQEKFRGQNIAIFYHTQLGFYPYISKDGEEVNGGIPQRGNLEAHLSRARAQIDILMGPKFHGLAVIDWEEWDPLWVHNFGVKKKYQQFSMQLVREHNPQLTWKEVQSKAHEEFELSASNFMSKTIQLGATMRSKGLWGYYGFPYCYNFHKGQHSTNYTGHCHPKTSERNDRLNWLWKMSSALYPSIYLPRSLARSHDAAHMVHYRVLEALRVSSKFSTGTRAIPVIPYARIAFIHTLEFLDLEDLQNTIGKAAALGASGIVLWGELSFAKSKRQCEALRDYIDSVLGSYVTTLKKMVHHCSKSLCGGSGRCASWSPISAYKLHWMQGAKTLDPAHLRDTFHCVCYHGWTGGQCQKKVL